MAGFGARSLSLLTNLCQDVLTRFKMLLATIAPQFAGMAQQDAQELVGVLIDALHEDLNIATHQRSAGVDDSHAGRAAWAEHLMHNDSPLTQLCYGLLRRYRVRGVLRAFPTR